MKAADLKEGMVVRIGHKDLVVWRDFVIHNHRAIGMIDGRFTTCDPDLDIERVGWCPALSTTYNGGRGI